MHHPAAEHSYSFSTTMEDHSFFSMRPVASSRIEVVYIEEGSGVIIAGEERTCFKSGDVIMTGGGLSHHYQLDAVYAAEMRHHVKVSVIRFLPDFLGETFLNLHETGYIKILLGKAGRGIMPDAGTCIAVRGLLRDMMSAAGLGKIILLLHILHKISVCRELRFLSLEGAGVQDDELDRMGRVYEYSRSNFYRKIDLEEIAAIAYVSPHSFCRWFKARTQKTYSRFLIELRVRHACRLLAESRLSAKMICLESGFNNFSNFHKCFKEVMGKSPMEYQREFRSVALFG
jgi:AraC-like DNA-binding protein